MLQKGVLILRNGAYAYTYHAAKRTNNFAKKPWLSLAHSSGLAQCSGGVGGAKEITAGGCMRLFSSQSNPGSSILQSRWKQSTDKILDREETSLGSFDSLRWQLAETMIIHWAQTGGTMGLQRCFQLLERLVDESASNPSANFHIHIYLVHAVLKRWNSLLRRSETDLLPSQVLERIDSYLNRAKCFDPNIVTYTIILDGASQCAIPDERLVLTETLLLRLIEESESNPALRPTIVSFGTVINAWARSGSPAAAEKAENLLERVYALHERGWPNLEPNTQVYTSTINAWANAGDPERAEALLKKMYEEYMLHGNEKVKPNAWTFNSVLAAWWKSSSPHAFESAEKLLRLMIELADKGDLDARPDVVSYNCLLHKLTRRKDDPNAFVKGESLVHEMIQRSLNTGGDQAVLPNLNTFSTLFRLMATSNISDQGAKADFWLRKANDLGISEDRFLLDQYSTWSLQPGSSEQADVNLELSAVLPETTKPDVKR